MRAQTLCRAHHFPYRRGPSPHCFLLCTLPDRLPGTSCLHCPCVALIGVEEPALQSASMLHMKQAQLFQPWEALEALAPASLSRQLKPGHAKRACFACPRVRTHER